jgi:hypothetical protein
VPVIMVTVASVSSAVVFIMSGPLCVMRIKVMRVDVRKDAQCG